MNPIRLLRKQVGITQEDLAKKAGTSQPTIALYEAGAKSPTLATLQKLASSLGLELCVTYIPPLTREDRRSLAYHRAIVTSLRKDSGSAIKQAKRTLNRMTGAHPGAKALFDRWRLWLDFPVEELISRLLDPGLVAREMRQVSPFAGLLEPHERFKILKEFQRE
jgi:transcriptional regulator with XRE-family HTH domain